MRVDIEVSNYGDDTPYVRGVATVRLNGEVIAKLRTCESVSIWTEEKVWMKVDQPLGLKQ